MLHLEVTLSTFNVINFHCKLEDFLSYCNSKLRKTNTTFESYTSGYKRGKDAEFYVRAKNLWNHAPPQPMAMPIGIENLECMRNSKRKASTSEIMSEFIQQFLNVNCCNGQDYEKEIKIEVLKGFVDPDDVILPLDINESFE